MSYVSNMNFEVNSDAVISGIINGEIQARMCCKAKYPNSTEEYKKGLQKYKEAGIVNSTPSVVNFMKKHQKVFNNSKLVSYTRGNIFEEMITLSSQCGDYDESLKTRMTIGHELTPEEIAEIEPFLQEFHTLTEQSDIKAILSETKQYSRSVERLWKTNESEIMEHIESILGYLPENVGNVKTYVMYPNYDTHRTCQSSGNNTALFLGKRGTDVENKILAHLTHQAVHQPMLPYKISMSKQDKEKFHAFIKFLTDKEIFSKLSGESALKITTPQENHALMGKIYPYWLGYRFRNASKQGLEPAKEIEKVIQRDKAYYDALPEGSKLRSYYSHYEFDKLDPNKIAEFFKFKKGMSPYEFIEIDFDNRENVCNASTSRENSLRRQQRNIEEDVR